MQERGNSMPHVRIGAAIYSGGAQQGASGLTRELENACQFLLTNFRQEDARLD